MFEIFNQNKQILPIKVWLKSVEDIDDVCMTQSINLANIPFAFKWISLMPDTHQGFGMPIGGVLALKNHIIPNAVGVDIGCGMIFVDTSLKLSDLTDEKQNKIIKKIMGRIPVGFKHREEPLHDQEIEDFIKNSDYDYTSVKTLYNEVEGTFYQLGTLGGGNHFIELQKDDDENISIMIHSGSRNFGYKVARYYNDKADLYCKKNESHKLSKKQLSFLKADTDQGNAYIKWMELALLFARRNRKIMLDIVKEILVEECGDVDFFNEINAHHNYASLEEHYGEMVWVHRKGAIKVHKGEKGIIPGAMGSYSYIVEGLGNPESFYSCSHGAGRHLSRKQAEKEYDRQSVLADLDDMGVKIGIPNKSQVADESRFAYKDINEVMENQKDLCTPVKRLRTVMVVKG